MAMSWYMEPLAETEEAQSMGAPLQFTWIQWVWSIGLGVIFCLLFWTVAKAADAGVQLNSICNRDDYRVCWTQGDCDTFHGKSRLIAHFSLTIFVWIFPHERNGLDSCRLDSLSSSTDWCKCIWYGPSPRLFQGCFHLQIPNITLGMALSVFCTLILFYSIREKGSAVSSVNWH